MKTLLELEQARIEKSQLEQREQDTRQELNQQQDSAKQQEQTRLQEQDRIQKQTQINNNVQQQNQQQINQQYQYQQANRLQQQRVAAQARENRMERNDSASVQYDKKVLEEQKAILRKAKEQEQGQQVGAASVNSANTLEQYRQNGLLTGVSNTFEIGKDGSEQININEKEFQKRQSQLENQSTNTKLDPLEQERAGLLKDAEKHSYRAEQYSGIIEAEQRLGGTELSADNFLVKQQQEHEQAAAAAVEKLHEFDMQHGFVNADCVPIADQHRPEFAQQSSAAVSDKAEFGKENAAEKALEQEPEQKIERVEFEIIVEREQELTL